MGRASKEAYPIAFGIVNTGGQLGGALTPLLVGIILDNYNWNAVFATLAVGSFICLLAVLSIIEPIDKPLEKPGKAA